MGHKKLKPTPNGDYPTKDDARYAANTLVEYLRMKEEDSLKKTAERLRSGIEAMYADIDTGDSMYGARVSFVDTDGDAYTALVMEPSVSEIPLDEAYDPHKDKMVDPSEYPLGTVQLVYTPDYNLSDGFNFDRLSHLEVRTSVQPGTHPDDTYCYFAGWDYALKE